MTAKKRNPQKRPKSVAGCFFFRSIVGAIQTAGVTGGVKLGCRHRMAKKRRNEITQN
ncbi:membrane or secreted protein [Rhodopirellula maiorica SM1]|uniref:Membrane or secreted protein n=1 Tax=Rhodopirellula maiorica SM1 TaxID=1265738 RepID=M5RSR1_9BACT|nr:membrane or secreted protein [Rhodopirellula maiorica SM1]